MGWLNLYEVRTDVVFVEAEIGSHFMPCNSAQKFCLVSRKGWREFGKC